MHSSPELALLVGNIIFFPFGLKQKLVLCLKEKKEIAQNTFEFIFETKNKFNFKSGQYLEWHLPHKKRDKKGERRYFTISSSPTEKEIKIGFKCFQNNLSSYKKALLEMNIGDKIFANNLDGDFVLPKEQEKKLVFIAGGIGITPFRSILKYLLDKNEKRDIVLFYSNKIKEEIAYQELLNEMKEKFKIKIIYLFTEEKEKLQNEDSEIGFLNEKIIKKYVPDYEKNIFYISGPNKMVENYKNLLKEMKIKNIITDYFSGYA